MFDKPTGFFDVGQRAYCAVCENVLKWWYERVQTNEAL